jgi:hypothetical protein
MAGPEAPAISPEVLKELSSRWLSIVTESLISVFGEPAEPLLREVAVAAADRPEVPVVAQTVGTAGEGAEEEVSSVFSQTESIISETFIRMEAMAGKVRTLAGQKDRGVGEEEEEVVLFSSSRLNI